MQREKMKGVLRVPARSAEHQVLLHEGEQGAEDRNFRDTLHRSLA